KRIEKLSLPIFLPPHHAPLPLMPSPPRNHGSRVVSTGVLQHNRAESGSTFRELPAPRRPLQVDGTAVVVIQAPKPQPRIMRYE
ncbi:hypothetical protein, partial [Bradyrhizobium algeriense]|uniref:hypothetical protein n=1 Tax=Bradyrhizobium algeriense TaxID=634784 RepID=UPI001AECEEC8